MRSDPFAPAHSPLHPKNVRNAFAPDAESLQALTRQEQLQRLHMTDHEGPGHVPTVEELLRRQTLVDEFREQLATEGPDAEPPTLVDETGQTYVWWEGDRPEGGDGDPDGQPDGTTSSGWRHVGQADDGAQSEEDGGDAPSGKTTVDDAAAPEVPPRNGPGSDTDTWRAFAAQATDTEPAQWATLTRTDIIATLERDGVIPSEQA